jgi:fatty acid desaturase
MNRLSSVSPVEFGCRPEELGGPLPALSVAERATIKRELAATGVSADLAALKRPNSARATVWIVTDSLSLWAAVVTAFKFPELILICALVGASRIRAIATLYHDCAHRNLFSKRWINEAVGNWLIGPLCFEDLRVYRRDHSRHHGQLGSYCDPDLTPMVKCKNRARRAFLTYARLLLNFKFWLGSLQGNLLNFPLSAALRFAAFWSVVMLVDLAIFGPKAAGAHVLIFLLFRATVYHGMRVFLELCDHGFLEPVSELEFTRNMPPRSVCTWFFHSHNDCFHITHHLYPDIPLSTLDLAHAALMKSPTYAKAHHCSSYFFGNKSVVASWTGSFESK